MLVAKTMVVNGKTVVVLKEKDVIKVIKDHMQLVASSWNHAIELATKG